MKERFALLAAYFKEKLAIGKKSGKEKRKSMILSIVALVEVGNRYRVGFCMGGNNFNH